jgi:hypothetical protein
MVWSSSGDSARLKYRVAGSNVSGGGEGGEGIVSQLRLCMGNHQLPPCAYGVLAKEQLPLAGCIMQGCRFAVDTSPLLMMIFCHNLVWLNPPLVKDPRPASQKSYEERMATVWFVIFLDFAFCIHNTDMRVCRSIH